MEAVRDHAGRGRALSDRGDCLGAVGRKVAAAFAGGAAPAEVGVSLAASAARLVSLKLGQGAEAGAAAFAVGDTLIPGFGCSTARCRSKVSRTADEVAASGGRVEEAQFCTAQRGHRRRTVVVV